MSDEKFETYASLFAVLIIVAAYAYLAVRYM